MAREYMEKMGYGEQPYIAFLHNDTGRPHLHIVSVRVDKYGKKIDDSFEYEHSNKIRKRLEKKYGLTPARKGDEENLPIKPVNYSEGNLKAQIRSVVLSCLDQYKFGTIGELDALLRQYNVNVREIKGVVEGTDIPYKGLQFCAIDENGEQVGNPIKASSFNERMSHAGISQHIEDNAPYLKDLNRRRELGNRVRQVITALYNDGSLTEDNLKEQLERAGVIAVFRRNKQGRLTGATFIDRVGKTVYNGSKLGKDLSANEFNKMFSGKPYEWKPIILGEDKNDKNIKNNSPQSNTYHEYDSRDEFTTGLFDFYSSGSAYEELDPELGRYKKRKKKKKL